MDYRPGGRSGVAPPEGPYDIDAPGCVGKPASAGYPGRGLDPVTPNLHLSVDPAEEVQAQKYRLATLVNKAS